MHLVYLLTRPIHLMLQPHVLSPHPVNLEITVLDLLLHALQISVEVSRTATASSSLTSHHVKIKFKLLDLRLKIDLSLAAALYLVI